jgi:hypothetical protein
MENKYWVPTFIHAEIVQRAKLEGRKKEIESENAAREIFKKDKLLDALVFTTFVDRVSLTRCSGKYTKPLGSNNVLVVRTTP